MFDVYAQKSKIKWEIINADFANGFQINFVFALFP